MKERCESVGLCASLFVGVEAAQKSTLPALPSSRLIPHTTSHSRFGISGMNALKKSVMPNIECQNIITKLISMTATVPFIQQTFNRFNALCFDGVLPTVPIVLAKAGTFLGKMEYKSRRDFFGIISSHYDFRLKISTGFDLSQEELEDVVIHEMIHYYIAYRNLRDSSVHGETFRRIMETINQKYGRHITVRHHGEPEQNLVRSGSEQIKKHFLCVSTLSDGNMGITVCASTKIFELYRKLPKYYRITKMEWYGSLDPFFNRFPRANTPKIYKITKDELSEHLQDSVPLRCDGHTIEPI